MNIEGFCFFRKLPSATKYAADNGVESFAIGIGDYDLTELNLISGDEDRVLTVNDFENLNEIVSKLQNDIQILEGKGKKYFFYEFQSISVGCTQYRTGKYIVLLPEFNDMRMLSISQIVIHKFNSIIFYLFLITSGIAGEHSHI